jgi:hypothetical protein
VSLTYITPKIGQVRVRVILFNATFNKFQLYGGCQFNSWRKWEYPEKTTDPSKVTDKLYHMMYRVHLSCGEFQLMTLVVICTDCIGSYKFNHHTTTATTAKSEVYLNLNNFTKSKWKYWYLYIYWYQYVLRTCNIWNCLIKK